MDEHQLVVLTRDVAEHALRRGDVGTIVLVYPDRTTYEVELATGDGRTLALLTMDASDVRPVRDDEILHVRALGDAETRTR